MFSGFRTIDNNIFNQFDLIHREFESAFNQLSKKTDHNDRTGNMYPPVNISSTEDAFVVTLFVSNLKSDAIDITVDNNILSIKAEKEDSVPKEAKLLVKERVEGRVLRKVTLPKNSDVENIVADYKYGVLTVNIAKQEKTQAIKVKVH